MSTLVDNLRRMTSVSATQYEIDGRAYWTDKDLEAVLDGRVCEVIVQAEINLIPSISSTGHLVFLNGFVQVPGVLDTSTATIVAFNGGAIEGDYTIGDDGQITFELSQATALPLLSGLCYDMNGAAADVLTDWAAAVQLGYDISTDGQQMSRSQRHSQLLKQAEAFRARGPIGSVQMRRSDVKAGGRRSQRSDAALKSWKRWGRWG